MKILHVIALLFLFNSKGLGQDRLLEGSTCTCRTFKLSFEEETNVEKVGDVKAFPVLIISK